MIQLTEEITERLKLIALNGNEKVLLHPLKNIKLYKEKILKTKSLLEI